MRYAPFAYLSVALLIAACSPGSSTDDSATVAEMGGSVDSKSAPSYRRWYEKEQVFLGARVFREHCSVCHGLQAEGAPNWQSPDPDGKYPAPPLNGSGHGWHHPLRILYSVIMNGSPGGQGNMPSWREKLSDEEALAAIAWFQSYWPQEIYDNWAQRDIASRK